jgi:hypothetical protein
MKWFNLSPSLPILSTIPLLWWPLLSDAGAAASRPIQPRAPVSGKPSSGPAAPSGAPAQPAPPGFVVQSVPVNHRPAAEMKNLLAALVTPGGSVLEQPGG